MDSFHFLAIMNSAATNICIQVFVWMYVFISFGYIPGSRIVQSYVTLCLTFENLPNYFPKQFSSFYIPTSNVQGFQFLHLLVNICYSSEPWLSYHSGCEVILIMVLICIFWWLMMLSTFSCAYWPLIYLFFEKCSLPIF